MIAYFVRRVIGGVVQLLMALCIIFYIVTGFPVGQLEELMPCLHCPYGRLQEYIRFIEEKAFIDKPWPLNFVDWLFDPDEPITRQSYDLQGNPLPPIQKGLDITIGNLQIKGSGVLTGDLGVSVNFDQGMPVTDMFGHGIDKVFAALMSLITALIAIAAAQRLGRPRSHRIFAAPIASTLADWWHLHAASPSGVIIKRQWG